MSETEPRPEQPTEPAPAPGDPSGTPTEAMPPPLVLKSAEERKQILAQAVANQLALGNARVETQGDFNTVIVKGKPVNHVLHLLITLFTCGLWAIVWIILAVTQGEKRLMLSIDEYGSSTLQTLS